MSYIRSGSNPEGLYIYPSSSSVCLHVDTDIYNIDPDDFYDICEQYHNEGCSYEPLENRTLRIEEKWYNEKGEAFEVWDRNPTTHLKILLFHKDVFVCAMWITTWAYIVNNVLAPERKQRIWRKAHLWILCKIVWPAEGWLKRRKAKKTPNSKVR